MQVLDILVTVSPWTADLGNGWSMGPAECDRPAFILTRHVMDRRLVCDEIENAMRSCAFVHRHDNYGFVEIVIHEPTRRWRSKARRQIEEILKTHRDVTKNTLPSGMRSEV